MTNPGLGVMLFMLGGGSKHSSEEYVGKEINDAFIRDNKLHVHFTSGHKICIYDDGQSCCEARYMTCDDTISDLIDGTLISIQVQDGPSLKKDEPYSEDHDQQFLVVQSTKGTITIANHNEHNGYYGGFGMTIEEYQ